MREAIHTTDKHIASYTYTMHSCIFHSAALSLLLHPLETAFSCSNILSLLFKRPYSLQHTLELLEELCVLMLLCSLRNTIICHAAAHNKSLFACLVPWVFKQSPLSAMLAGLLLSACPVKRMQHTSPGHATLQHLTHIHDQGSGFAPPQAGRHIPESCCQQRCANKRTDAQRSAYLLQETSEQHPDRGQVLGGHLSSLYAPHLRLCILLDCFTICLILLPILLPSAALQASHLDIMRT